MLSPCVLVRARLSDTPKSFGFRVYLDGLDVCLLVIVLAVAVGEDKAGLPAQTVARPAGTFRVSKISSICIVRKSALFTPSENQTVARTADIHRQKIDIARTAFRDHLRLELVESCLESAL